VSLKEYVSLEESYLPLAHLLLHQGVVGATFFFREHLSKPFLPVYHCTEVNEQEPTTNVL